MKKFIEKKYEDIIKYFTEYTDKKNYINSNDINIVF